MSTFGSLMAGCIRAEAFGEVPTGSSVFDLKERAQVAAQKAAQHAAAGHKALARSWQNAATRLRKELQERLRHTSLASLREKLPGKSEPQEQRQRGRVQGRYAKMSPCPRCGKSRAVGPAYSISDGGRLPDESKWVGEYICDPCVKAEGKSPSLGEVADLTIGTPTKVIAGGLAVAGIVLLIKKAKQRNKAAERSEET